MCSNRNNLFQITVHRDVWHCMGVYLVVRVLLILCVFKIPKHVMIHVFICTFRVLCSETENKDGKWNDTCIEGR